MSLDFARIKAISIVEVVQRYGIKLRFQGDWGAALCPLPSHKQGEKDKTFQVSIPQNYFKCWSASCNEKAGCKGGDTINFVALMDDISQYEAAKKLSAWYKLPDAKTAPSNGEARREVKQEPQRTVKKYEQSSDSVNYMATIDKWYDDTSKRREGEDDAAFRKRFLNALKAKLIQSYKAGQKAA